MVGTLLTGAARHKFAKTRNAIAPLTCATLLVNGQAQRASLRTAGAGFASREAASGRAS